MTVDHDGTRPYRATLAAGLMSSANDAAAGAEVVLRNESALLWDLGDGVAGFELRTKMNVIDPQAQDALEAAIEAVRNGFRALVIANDHPRAFSCGADLRHFASLLRDGKPGPIERFVAHGQAVYRRLLAAPFPVVAAAFGLALGGGCELLLHCDRIVSHAGLIAGLPEVKVGLLPGWGGCVRMMHRHAALADASDGSPSASIQVFDMLASAKLSTSALDARSMGILRAADRIVPDRDGLLTEAKSEASAMAERYEAPQPRPITVPGPAGLASMTDGVLARQRLGKITDHDALVASVIARVLSGGAMTSSSPIDEDALYALERDGLVELVLTTRSRDRIEEMLATGKPLRN